MSRINRDKTHLSFISACTSVPVKISYHSTDDYKAVIQLVDFPIWEKDIEGLIGDLFNEYGEFDRKSTEGAVAWAKVRPCIPPAAISLAHGIAFIDVRGLPIPRVFA